MAENSIWATAPERRAIDEIFRVQHWIKWRENLAVIETHRHAGTDTGITD